jgi:alkanesulfonate monooxygenase
VVDHESDRYPLRGALVSPRPAPPIPIYLGGHSAEAQQIAAEHADVYLLWGDTLPAVAERLASMREHEQRAGRRVRYGCAAT